LTHIESTQNSKYKLFKSLLSAKGIKQEALFILSGRKLVEESIQQRSELIVWEIITNEQVALTQLPDDKIIQLPNNLFKELDLLGTHYNLLVMKLPDFHQGDLNQLPHKAELILPLSDPGNLGAMIRSAVAFGIKKIWLTQEAAHPFLPKAIKASSGACFLVDFYVAPSIQQIKSPCIALDAGGEMLEDFQWPNSFRLLVGEEGKGVPTQIPITPISIRMEPGIESLNATVAMSIALHHWKLGRKND
jgi:RNA methyltransferase, TrmH family